MQEKVCIDCGISKPLSDFYSVPRGRLGVGTRCRLCDNIRSTKWKKENSGRVRATHRTWLQNNPDRYATLQRKYTLKRKYGLAEEDYYRLLAVQGGVCKICKLPERRKDGRTRKIVPLSVDHDHGTGRVRGLLCSSCNGHLGWYDSYQQELSVYLKEPQNGA